MRLLELQFYSWRQEEIVRGQIRWVVDNSHFVSCQKLLH